MMENASPKPPVSPPKGRPTAERVYEINRAILEAATKCFLTSCSYDGASMDAIAIEARVSKMTLYARHDKESLFEAVIQDRLARWWRDDFKQDPTPGNTLDQRLKEHVRLIMVIGSSKEVRAFHRLISTAPPRLAHTLRQVRYNHMIDILSRDIDEFSPVAEAAPTRDSRRTATDLLVLLAGWLHMESMLGPVSEQDAVEFGNHAVDLLLAARAAW
jgi:AcrR family transcriptional regulator